MKTKFTWNRLIIWLILNVFIVLLMDLALFQQTTPEMKNASFFKKVMGAEKWATIEWLFVIPANRMGIYF